MRKVKKSFGVLISIIFFFFGFLVLPIKVKAENGYVMFPMKYMNISNGESGHGGRLIIDICGYDTGRDAFYAPFDGKVVRMNFGSGNSIIIESSNPVKWADGTVDYVHMWLTHDDDVSDLYEGKTFKQGEEIYREGTTGISTGNHVHMICGRGRYPTSGGLKEISSGWTLTNQVSAYNVLHLYGDTIVKNAGGYSWKTLSGSISNFVDAGTADGLRLQNSGVTSITDTTARINATLSPAGDITEAGFYLGTSLDNMQKKVEKISQADCVSIWYDLGTGKWSSALQKGTTYYYQIYAVIGGITYKSSVDSFTTTGDGQVPVVSNVSITDVTSDGYTVTCMVTDNIGVAKVCFPTWTEANGQDDLATNWGESTAVYSPASGNTYSYRVNVSDHNYESGTYITHIYAYDAAGNYTSFATGSTITRDIALESFTLSNNTLALDINQTQQLSVLKYNPSNTTVDKTATWASSNESVVSVDNQGNVTGLKQGIATITCTVAGKTQICKVTVSNAVLEEFSGWRDSLPSEVANNTALYEIQQKTQYRSSTKSETVSQDPNLNGWTKSSEWWGEWQPGNSGVSATDTREVKQEQQYVKTQYKYNHWHNYSNGNTSPVQYSGWTYEETGWLDYQLTAAGTSNAGGTKYSAGSNKLGPCGYTAYWYNESKQDVYNTLYYYREKYFGYYQWSAWSDWSDNAVTASDSVNVQTRTVYRYRYIGPSITTQPSNQVVEENETATFSVAVNGRNLSYQWQTSKDGGKTWSNSALSGNKTASLQVLGVEGRNGYQFRCIITDINGNSITSSAVALTVHIETKLLSQPANQSIEVGDTATFKVKVRGNNLIYQWQASIDGGGTWKNSALTGNKTANLQVIGTDARDGYQFRCIVKDELGNSVISNAVKLTVIGKAKIAMQPVDQSIETGQTATFTVKASGLGLSYQWQTSADGGRTWKDSGLAGNKTASLQVVGTEARDGYRFRCVVKDKTGGSVTSVEASLAVAGKAQITRQPESQSIDAGKTAVFSIEAKGTGLSYQWQTSADGGKTWSLQVVGTEARDGYQFRCVVKDGLGNSIISNVGKLFVNTMEDPLPVTSAQKMEEVFIEAEEETEETQDNQESEVVLGMPTVSGGDLVQSVIK